MAGILDDAELRKGKAAEIVSSDTALALATELGDAALAAVVRANRTEEIAADRALRTLLGEPTR